MTRTVVTILALTLLVACADDELAETSDESAEIPDELVSGTTDAFEVVELNGTAHVVGHGITLEIPSNWVTYEEKRSIDGSTMEWAVGAPEDTQPFPHGLQFSAGIEGRGGQVESGMAIAAKKIAELSPGYEFIDEGEVDIPGASEARYLRFTRDLDISIGTFYAEQLSLFIQVADGVSTTIRFIAPEGQWDADLNSVYESVRTTA